MGIIAVVKSGLAITASGKSIIPDDVRILGPTEGFPDLPSIVITLLKSKNSISQATNVLANYVAESFGELIHNKRGKAESKISDEK